MTTKFVTTPSTGGRDGTRGSPASEVQSHRSAEGGSKVEKRRDGTLGLGRELGLGLGHGTGTGHERRPSPRPSPIRSGRARGEELGRDTIASAARRESRSRSAP